MTMTDPAVPTWLLVDRVEQSAEHINRLTPAEREQIAVDLYQAGLDGALPPAAIEFVRIFHPDTGDEALAAVSDPIDGWLILDPYLATQEALDQMAAAYRGKARMVAQLRHRLGRGLIDAELLKDVGLQLAMVLEHPEPSLSQYRRAIPYLLRSTTE